MKTKKTTTSTYKRQGGDRIFDFEQMLTLTSRAMYWTRRSEKANFEGFTSGIARSESRIEEWRERILEDRELFDLMFPPGSPVRMELGF